MISWLGYEVSRFVFDRLVIISYDRLSIISYDRLSVIGYDRLCLVGLDRLGVIGLDWFCVVGYDRLGIIIGLDRLRLRFIIVGWDTWDRLGIVVFDGLSSVG